MSAQDLKKVCYQRMITGDDIVAVLDAYADHVEKTEPHAHQEIDLARMIGLNIRDILDEVAE